MGQALLRKCMADEAVLGDDRDVHSRFTQMPDAETPRKDDGLNWIPVDVRKCDAELVVLAVLKEFAPTSLRRYLQRRQQLPSSMCYEYDSYDDGGFKITVQSHALTIDTAVDKWRVRIAEKGLPELSVAFVRVIGASGIATFEAPDDDRSKLRCVNAVKLPGE
mmetsp:Transcript_56917/g.123149  ORF Transcript_56917/g.123149 Transcript_56917/m.123149 type:complete len:163 (-) Transcript_56917:99-587(-)|eukprot:CAMPEP_0170572628 /NCGR_PEP_ID=MMETSP0224-20130122/2319_1 /TAXON_ID=285029 /ORGANISM="Togula jolla, Strain CCCM 725" /LENGTH=162 /DNA_ID=CAMNT_0010895133 /DNA_START=1 /DNA_END=489 /DNA_ORIENTATION=-